MVWSDLRECVFVPLLILHFAMIFAGLTVLNLPPLCTKVLVATTAVDKKHKEGFGEIYNRFSYWLIIELL